MITSNVATVTKLARKSVRHLRSIYRNPNEFLRNLSQFTNPSAFLADLLKMPSIPPIRIEVDEDPGASLPVALNILLPAIMPHGMTGGPNTALMIGARLAHAGIPVRFVSCDVQVAPDTTWFWKHLEQLTGIPGRPAGATLQDACVQPLKVSADDMFMASFWTTAHQVAAVLPLTRRTKFIYLIQDFEPGFYAWSNHYVLAMETLNLPCHAIINQSTLADFLFETRIGNFRNACFRSSCTVFEPSIDRQRFKPADQVATRPRRLLLYARPTNLRNLLGIAVAALRSVIADPLFSGDWEFLAIGARGSLPVIPLGNGRFLREAAWQDLLGYATLLRTSDILLVPMLSPHTGYPALEMAASGGIAVTNSFATKTPDRMARLSPNILIVEPTVEGFETGLLDAARQVIGGARRSAELDLPLTWEESLREAQQVTVSLLHRTDEAMAECP